MAYKRHRLPTYDLSVNGGDLRRAATKSEIQKYMSVIGHGSDGGMSRQTYSKNGTGLERIRGCLEPRRERGESGGEIKKKVRS